MHFLARRAVVKVLAAKGGIKMAPKAPYLASAAILYNSRGRSTQPACKAKPITGRTLAAQGLRPDGWLNPHARKGVSTYGNTGKRRPADWYLPAFHSLIILTEILRFVETLQRVSKSAEVGP